MRKLTFITVLFCMCCLLVVPALADTTVGQATGGNSFPFGFSYSGDFQQVYNQGAFSGPITITNLEFFNTISNSGVTAMTSGTFTIWLSTTSANSNTLSGNYTANLGANNTQVFSGSLAQSWAFGDTLSISLSTPFTYDPSAGNLLMTVDAENTSTPSGNIFFDYDNTGNAPIGRVFNWSGNPSYGPGVNSGYGLVTKFSTNPVSPTPEPSSLILLGTGLIGFAGAIRRKLAK